VATPKFASFGADTVATNLGSLPGAAIRRAPSLLSSLAIFAAIRHSLAGRTQGAVSTYALVTHYGDGRKGRRFVFSFAALIASRRLGL